MAVGFHLSRAELLRASSPRRAGRNSKAAQPLSWASSGKAGPPELAGSHSHVPECRAAEPQWHRELHENLLARQGAETSPGMLFPQSPHSCCLSESPSEDRLNCRKAHLLEGGHPCQKAQAHVDTAASIPCHSQDLSSTGR